MYRTGLTFISNLTIELNIFVCKLVPNHFCESNSLEFLAQKEVIKTI